MFSRPQFPKMARTTSTKVEGPVMSLDLNKDNHKVAAAGRRAFKIFAFTENSSFVEEVDLRGNDTVNLNYSFNDVVWNWRDENLLATAATNGAIILWNLHKIHSKQDRVLVDHKRTVNRVNFHTSEPWLISGSQDGTVRIFDLRIREQARVYNSKTDGIRDVKWSPHASMNFAAISENGSVQLWDARRSDKCYMHYAAHSEPIFSCDWHPELPWLATSSRDKSVKVWDVTLVRPVLKYVINTISSVGRIKWRPHHKFHIASTALVVDRNVNIWDVRRPYIPYSCFTGHRDIVTDIKWKSDPHYLLSAGRDCYIIHHIFSDSICPADAINPHALSINSRGDILQTHRVAVRPQKAISKIQGLLRRSAPVDDSFCQASSRLNIFTSMHYTVADEDAKFFIECAIRYRFYGKPLNEICDHNAYIASRLGRPDVSFIWMVVKQIFTSNYFDLEEQSSVEELDDSVLQDDYDEVDGYQNENENTSCANGNEANILITCDTDDGKINTKNSNSHVENIPSNIINHVKDNNNSKGVDECDDARKNDNETKAQKRISRIRNIERINKLLLSDPKRGKSMDEGTSIIIDKSIPPNCLKRGRSLDDTVFISISNGELSSNKNNDSINKNELTKSVEIKKSDKQTKYGDDDGMLDKNKPTDQVECNDNNERQISDDELINESYMSVGDFLFGDRDMDPFSLDYDNYCENSCFSSGVFADKFDIDEYDWRVPVEGFAPRHEIKEGPLPPELLPINIAPSYSRFDRAMSQVKFIDSDNGPYELVVKKKVKMPFWNSSEIIANALHYHANRGDFQTAVAVLLVLGDRRRFLTRRDALDEMIQEQWLLAYIDMLNRYKLWNITTKVIQNSWISSVYQLNQHSTTMRTCCGKCRRPMVRCGWICDRCHTRGPSICSLCHEVVKGLFAWCQGCTHGGHIHHIKSWFRTNRLCPAGCGHMCEY